MDELLGKELKSIPLYSDGVGETVGKIGFHEKGILVKTSRTEKIPDGYVKSLRARQRLSLGRVEAEMTAFDIMGTQLKLSFVLLEPHFFELQQRIEKKGR